MAMAGRYSGLKSGRNVCAPMCAGLSRRVAQLGRLAGSNLLYGAKLLWRQGRRGRTANIPMPLSRANAIGSRATQRSYYKLKFTLKRTLHFYPQAYIEYGDRRHFPSQMIEPWNSSVHVPSVSGQTSLLGDMPHEAGIEYNPLAVNTIPACGWRALDFNLRLQVGCGPVCRQPIASMP